MRAVIPEQANSPWTTVGINAAGEGEDVLIALGADPSWSTAAIRTIARTGVRLDEMGVGHGMDLSWQGTAALALFSLAAELDAAEGHGNTPREIEKRLADARQLASDRSAWAIEALQLDGEVYALWTIAIRGGAAAHADLGWAVVGMWSTGSLPRMSFRLADLSASGGKAPEPDTPPSASKGI